MVPQASPTRPRGLHINLASDKCVRRTSIVDGAGGIGTLEIATVMIAVVETWRYLT
jgi:hypothetical protein